MMFRHESARKLYPNVITTVDDKSYDSSGNLIDVDEELVLKENAKLEKEFHALQFQRDRTYPLIGEQLDMQYWDQVNGTTTWKDAIAKVKSDNPKP